MFTSNKDTNLTSLDDLKVTFNLTELLLMFTQRHQKAEPSGILNRALSRCVPVIQAVTQNESFLVQAQTEMK